MFSFAGGGSCRFIGLSIAMGNAIDDVKRQATYVTTSNEDEGFAGAIAMILKASGGAAASTAKGEK